MDQRLPARSRALFVPKTEWIEKDEALTLRVYLSGFTEKHIDCRIIAPSRYVRVCSDPALQNWHFNTLFENIPENFNLYLAKTKFEDGIFTIKVPKKIIPAQISPTALEATTRAQESNTGKSGPQKSEDGTGKQQTWTTNADKEIKEVKDAEGDLIGANANEGMSQKDQDQIPPTAKFPLAFTSKLEVDDQSTIAQVGDQEAAIKKDQEKSSDQEKEKEAKDMENESSSSSKSEKENIATTVVTERRYIVDKCTILSVILAIGAFVFYNIYGQSRKKKSLK